MVSKKQLQNLARGRAVRKANLQARPLPRRPQRVPRKRVVVPRGRAIRQRNLQMQRRPQRVRQRRIVVRKGQTLINPRTFVNPDLDVSLTDTNFNKQISAKGETLFTNINDIIPPSLQRRRR